METNSGVDSMRAAIARFVDKAPGSNSLLAFIGHGIEVGGDNIFLPQDVGCRGGGGPAPGARPAPGTIREGGTLPGEFLTGCISFADVQRAFSECRGDNPADVTLFVFDCCRSVFAPAAPPPPRVEAKVLNSLVVFSTSSGRTAQDGLAGEGGPFMNAFTQEMVRDGLSIHQVFLPGLLPRSVG